MTSITARLVGGLLAAACLALPPPTAWAQAGGGYPDPQAPPPAAPVVEAAPVMWPAASQDTLATIRQRGVLRVGVVQVPPMVMLDREQRHVGYSVDLARRLADDLGVKLEFVETWWTEVIDDLLQRRTDVIITGLWINVPRALVINFSQPTATEGIHLIGSRVRAAQRRTAEAFNQPGVVIAVSSDAVQQRVARTRFPKATVVPADDDPLLVVTEGRADAAVVATLSAEALVAAAPRRWFLPTTQPLARTSAAMAVRKGDTDFLAFLNTWLDIQRDQGWLDDRQRHWATSTEGWR